MSAGRFIVVFKEHVTKAEIDKYASDVDATGGEVHHRYDTVLNGFAATITDTYLSQLQNLQEDVIDYIEPDGIVTTQ